MYRYVLLLDAPGLGEQAMASGKIMDGLATKEAAEVEGPMWEQLGMIAGMQKPGAITAGLNWYRSVCVITCCVTSATSKGGGGTLEHPSPECVHAHSTISVP